MSSKPFVLIVEDDRDLADSLKSLFDDEGLPCVTFPSAEAFLRDELVPRCGCVVLDVRLPGLSGLDCQERLLSSGIQLPVVVITGEANVAETIRAFKHGAFAVLQKPVEPTELISTVRSAIALDVSRRQARNIRDLLLESLTDREREVLELLLQDKPTKQIARKLGVSSSTVEKDRAKILSKAGANSVVGLAGYYFRAQESAVPAPHIALAKQPQVKTA
jgi:FixJ family two-component response regulator